MSVPPSKIEPMNAGVLDRIAELATTLATLPDDTTRHELTARRIETLVQLKSVIDAAEIYLRADLLESVDDAILASDKGEEPGGERSHPGGSRGDTWVSDADAAAAELAPLECIGTLSARGRIHDADQLTRRYPDVLDAVASGAWRGIISGDSRMCCANRPSHSLTTKQRTSTAASCG